MLSVKELMAERSASPPKQGAVRTGVPANNPTEQGSTQTQANIQRPDPVVTPLPSQQPEQPTTENLSTPENKAVSTNQDKQSALQSLATEDRPNGAPKSESMQEPASPTLPKSDDMLSGKRKNTRTRLSKKRQASAIKSEDSEFAHDVNEWADIDDYRGVAKIPEDLRVALKIRLALNRGETITSIINDALRRELQPQLKILNSDEGRTIIQALMATNN